MMHALGTAATRRTAVKSTSERGPLYPDMSDTIDTMNRDVQIAAETVVWRA